MSSAPSEADARTSRRIGICSTKPSLGMPIVSSPTDIVELGPVDALLCVAEADYGGLPSRLDALAPPLHTSA